MCNIHVTIKSKKKQESRSRSTFTDLEKCQLHTVEWKKLGKQQQQQQNKSKVCTVHVK